ncbi:MAG: Methyl-accepting chemotaxis protein signaling domain protein [Firmicutes bacterium]|nr:Methyl-accepting chemotaxis protein signaling domain protein [Bacillota bacterium]
MKIGAKITAGFLIVLVVMIISSGIGVYLINEMNNTSDDLQEKGLVLLQKTNGLVKNNGLKVAAIRGFILTGKDSFLDDYNNLDKEDDVIIKELIDKAISAKGKQFAQEAKEMDDKYQKIVIEKIVPLRRAGKVDEAIVVMSNELAPAAAETRKKLDEYLKFREKQINDSFDMAQNAGNKANKTLLIMTVIAFVIGIGTSVIITRSVTIPLKLAVGDLDKMAEGDFSFKVPEQFLRTKDEVGDLARAMDKMLSSLNDILKKIAASAQNLAASSEQLTASAEQSAQAANQVAMSIVEVARGADVQMTAANGASVAVQQMSAGMQQAAANANTVAGVSDKTFKTAKYGSEIVSQAVSQMVAIEQSSLIVASAVGKLNERSQEIGQIVEAISGIAGQTNLLALNAAIEAARAGEQGRGFAVVAEEVRKLAEQSQEAAKKISSLIGEIRNDTEKAVVAMDTGVQDVKMGTEVVNAAGKTFVEIVELVNTVSSQVEDISATVQQMAGGSQQIVSSVQEIATVSKSTVGQTQTVSAATEEQSASMEEIASSSQALSRMAEELQLAIDKFKI